MQPPLLKVTNLSKAYREGGSESPVLSRLNLELDQGESAAVLGRSGCGKSTLLNLIAGLDQPDSGNILIDNQNLNQLSERQRTLLRRQQVGFVFQFFNLVPSLTVLENILLPLELIGIRDGEDRALEQLAAMGMARHQHRFPEQLSGGEQQRIAILRALAHRPRLLLADEPTGNLDQHTGDQIVSLLFDSVNDNTAMILVTHSEEIAAQAQRVYQLQEGKLTSRDKLAVRKKMPRDQ